MAAVDQQVAAYKKLVKAIDSAPSDSKVAAALVRRHVSVDDAHAEHEA